MISKYKKRICIVCRSLGEGGADRVAAMQSVFLSDLGYQVYIITILNDVKYPYKGELFNLGEIKEKNDTILGRFNRFYRFGKFLNNKSIDLVIDHRVRNNIFSEYVISGVLYSMKTVYMIHNYSTEIYIPPIKWISKLLYKRAKKIVCVSKTIEKKVKNIYGFNNLETIYNPIDFNYINKLKTSYLNLPYKFILWYGRFEEVQKNLALLLDSYHQSKLRTKDIKLVLMGHGKHKDKIVKQVELLQLTEFVVILPFSNNPFTYINQSLYTVISSHYEGFPMTVLESLACETPVISVKYKNFENGVVVHKKNGLLVDKNINALSKALNLFVEDEELLDYCKSNTINSVNKYDVKNIGEQWKNLIDA